MTDLSTPRPGLPRLIPTLGLFSAIMLVAGGVIGSGIFRKAGVMAAQVGSPEVNVCFILRWSICNLSSA